MNDAVGGPGEDDGFEGKASNGVFGPNTNCFGVWVCVSVSCEELGEGKVKPVTVGGVTGPFSDSVGDGASST